MPSHETPLIEKFPRSHPRIREQVAASVKRLAEAGNAKPDLDLHGATRCPVCSGFLGFCLEPSGKLSSCCKKPGCVAFLG